MSEWKKFNEELKQVIEKPTKKQMRQMDALHLNLYELHQQKNTLNQSLNKVNEKIERYMKKLDALLNSDNPPVWAWRWTFKKSNIKWKEEFIKRLGKVEANKILSVAKQNEYPKIGIQFIDPNPEDIPINPNELKKQSTPKRLTLSKPKLTLAERISLQKGN